MGAEWDLLRLLCQSEIPPALRCEICQKLRAQSFRDVNCRVLFEEIQRLSQPERAVAAEVLRENLPARATARGFPELDFDGLLEGAAGSAEELSLELKKVCEAFTAGEV